MQILSGKKSGNFWEMNKDVSHVRVTELSRFNLTVVQLLQQLGVKSIGTPYGVIYSTQVNKRSRFVHLGLCTLKNIEAGSIWIRVYC